MQRTDKVYGAAISCLCVCQDAPDPGSMASRFVDRLKADTAWSAGEVAEVAKLIFRQIQQSPAMSEAAH